MYIINDTNSLLNTNFANTLLRNSKAEVKEFEKAKYFLHIIHTNLDITTVCTKNTVTQKPVFKDCDFLLGC